MTDETSSRPRETKALPDWERIEADYRAGLLSLREIGAKGGGVTEGAIRKRAKKLGWTRDLAAKIQAKADDLVRKEAVRIRGTQQTEYAPAAERVLVEANAQAIATVRLSHRKDIATARALCVTLLAELNTVTGEQLTIELLADLRERLENPEPSEATTKALDKARDALSKAMSLPSRAGSLKALADSLKTLVGLEREAWGLEADKTPNPPDSNNEDTRDRNLRSIEALSARLAGPTVGQAAAPAQGAADSEPVGGRDP